MYVLDIRLFTYIVNMSNYADVKTKKDLRITEAMDRITYKLWLKITQYNASVH